MKANPLLLILATFLAATLVLTGCNQPTTETDKTETPEYFNLRPNLEKAYGYSHAVRIGNELKTSGVVSMDSAGNLPAPADLKQQMINCYADLDKVLKHYGYSWDDVVVENILTTDMPEFEEQAGLRNTVYKKQFPTGS